MGEVELCTKAGVGHQTFAKMLKGRMVRFGSVGRICDALDLPPAEIIKEVPDETLSPQGQQELVSSTGETLISLKTSRKGQALQLLEEYQAKKLGIYRVPHKKASDFFESYIEHCKKYNKASTIDDKQRTLGFFKNQAADPRLRQVNQKTIEAYLDARIGQRSKTQISSERFNSERQILSHFFNYLIKEKSFKENPVTGIEKKKIVTNKKPKSLSRTDEAILDAWLRGEGEDIEVEGKKLKGVSLEQRQELMVVKTVTIN